MVSKKGDKNDLVDSEKTPQSCVDVVFELLASTALLHLGERDRLQSLKTEYYCASKKKKNVLNRLHCLAISTLHYLKSANL